MKVHRFITATAGALAMTIGLSVAAAEAASAAPVRGSAQSAATASHATASRATVPVTGTFTNSAGQGTFSGTFTPQRFSVVGRTVEATGLLSGTLTDANGNSLGTVSRTVTMPVSIPGVTGATGAPNAANAVAAPSCSILNLVLGPLNLNLLGLNVSLNQVVLNITAIPGVGNLLGNLLCAVANLLNGGGSLSTLLNSIVALLNQILAAL